MLQPFLTNHRRLLTCLCVLVGAVWFVLAQGLPTVLGLVVCGVAAYLAAELDNAFALVRVSQRTVPALLFMLLAAAPAYHTLSQTHLSVLCSLLVYFPLLAAYQQPQLTVLPYLAFLALGVNALVASPLLLLSIPLWVAMAMMRSLSLRGWVATLLGILTPYLWWFALQPYLPPNWGVAPLTWSGWVSAWNGWAWQMGSTACYGRGTLLILLVWLVGLVDILRTSANDRTRTRIHHYAILLVSAVALALLLLRPVQAPFFLPWVLSGAAFGGGHFLTLSTGKAAHVIAIILCVLVVGAACAACLLPSNS